MGQIWSIYLFLSVNVLHQLERLVAWGWGVPAYRSKNTWTSYSGFLITLIQFVFWDSWHLDICRVKYMFNYSAPACLLFSAFGSTCLDTSPWQFPIHPEPICCSHVCCRCEECVLKVKTKSTEDTFFSTTPSFTLGWFMHTAPARHTVGHWAAPLEQLAVELKLLKRSCRRRRRRRRCCSFSTLNISRSVVSLSNFSL